MTKNYLGNPCAFVFNLAYTNTDIQGYRKGLYV